MINMSVKLQKLEDEGKPIKASIVGAGQMGCGMAAQMTTMKGMEPVVVVDINLDHAKQAYLDSGYKEGVDFVEASTVEEANKLLAEGKYIVTSNNEIATKCDIIDCAVDATGVPEVGAKVAVDAINAGKHICMLNVETDVCIGHILYKMANNAGVVYTGSAGDEPGAVIEMYDYAKGLGFDVKVVGKGKNNPVILDCTPESVAEIAKQKGASPKMICAFKDGTKTMVEMTAMANATGFKPDIIGAHGAESDVKHLNDVLSLKSEGRGGVLDNYGVIEYINGVAPGVFVIIGTDQPDIAAELTYLSMGPGPNYTLYRPYHLTSLETPMSVAKAVIDHEPTIVPRAGRVAETIAVAKKDLKAGDMLDGIGGFTVRGTFMSAEDADAKNALPMGLINKKTKMLKDVAMGEVITYDDIALDQDSLIVQLRKIQDELFI
ncbi:MAG: NAD(P)H-dependent oxidoreductase [Eubacteriaceae bacterium]|jgi:predicted homoserine dehydrogenase-like protein